MPLSKPADTSVSLAPLLRDRWSPRAFDQTPVTQAETITLLEAARWAPSAGNGQPWRFIVAPAQDQELFAKLLACLTPMNIVWAQHAPLLLVAVTQQVRDDGKPATTANYDLGLAVGMLTVQAAALDLVVHQMAGFSADAIRTAFAIPEIFTPITVIAVGHQGSHEQLPDELAQRERAPRTRRPLEQTAFGNHWGEPTRLIVPEMIPAST